MICVLPDSNHEKLASLFAQNIYRVMEGEFLMSRPSAECQYSGDYVTADLCKAFAFVFDGNHYVLRLTAPRLWYLLA